MSPMNVCPRVLIAGGGVAGLETLLALRTLAPDRLDITLLAPKLKFVNNSMSVDGPFKPKRARGIRLERMLAELDARWVRAKLDRVEHERRVAVTRDGERLSYDVLVVALGARPDRWAPRSLFHRDGSHPLVFYDGHESSGDYRMLLDRLHDGRVRKLAFVRPAGPTWPLPLYDLALLTAAECAAHPGCEPELTLVTPEAEPLGLFGHRASASVRGLLDDSGIDLHTASYGEYRPPGWLEIHPGDRGMEADRVVTEPRLVGPHLRGVPCDRDGFIRVDGHGRVAGFRGVYAAGDATGFPVKQGGLAAQQADAVAEAIAATVGVEIDPQPFRPVLRGVLLTGGRPRFLRADISGRAGDDSTVSGRPLWSPPNKLAGRYLAPYLSRQLDEAADVMPQDEAGTPVDTELAQAAPAEQPALTDLLETARS
jgi:sulfide:quinone oxidoreductase